MARYSRQFCRSCNQMVKAEQQSANHGLHIAASLLTAGLWVPLWIWFAAGNPYACTECGSRTYSTSSTFVRRSVQYLGFAVVGALLLLLLVAWIAS